MLVKGLDKDKKEKKKFCKTKRGESQVTIAELHCRVKRNATNGWTV